MEVVQTYEVIGRKSWRQEAPQKVLATITVSSSTLQLMIVSSNNEPVTLSCKIWEHTVHELEMLSSGLQLLSQSRPSFEIKVPRDVSCIGPYVTLTPVFHSRLGHSWENREQIGSHIFLDYFPEEEGNPGCVWIGIAINSYFSEAVLDVPQALALEKWISEQISRFGHEEFMLP